MDPARKLLAKLKLDDEIAVLKRWREYCAHAREHNLPIGTTLEDFIEEFIDVQKIEAEEAEQSAGQEIVPVGPSRTYDVYTSPRN